MTDEFTTEINRAIHTTIQDDATIISLVSTYAERAAVFGFRPVPGNAAPPYIAMGDVLAVNDAGTKNGNAAVEVFQDVYCFDDSDGSAETVRRISDRLRLLFNRQTITISGMTNYLTAVDGPQVAPTDEKLYGRVLTIRLVAEKT